MMRQINRIFGTAMFLVLLFSGSTVYAGMPMITLSRYGMERLIGISTAIFIVMVVAAIPIMFCWNALVAGSIKFYSETTDVKILEALAHPADGKP